MANNDLKSKESSSDVTKDFLLCNRCGSCRFVCPLVPVYREEWVGARGKVELAEAFLRGDRIGDRELRKIFDLCLHCMACEENCPSGVRADEIVMAARAEMARRGKMSRVKRLALRIVEGADGGLFRAMRALGFARRAPLHGVGGRSPLSILYPLLGWPRERFVPLPAAKPFLGSGPELYPAGAVDAPRLEDEALRRIGAGSRVDPAKAEDLARRVRAARERNLAAGKRVYFFVGHMVNNFFPEEARAVARLLNILGYDVLAPGDQLCCGAPVYYAGDIEGAREAATRVLESLDGKAYDAIITTCASGGYMLESEFPRLLDLNEDGYFEISYEKESDTFERGPRRSGMGRDLSRARELYRRLVEGKVRDVNELVAEALDLHDGHGKKIGGGEAEELHEPAAKEATPDSPLPVVTYHHPCHLNRGQKVDWQPEAILDALPGHRYVRMKDADRCCGGGGAFTFLNAAASAEIARVKIDAIEAVSPAVVATACPLCRIQLMDMMRRRRGTAAVPVKTPPELLLEEIDGLFRAGQEASRKAASRAG